MACSSNCSKAKSKAKAYTMGQGCATKPEDYPAPVKPTMSHGNPRTILSLLNV